MTDQPEDLRILALWAATQAAGPAPADGRARLLDALALEPHLPFCAALAQWFALPDTDMRALLKRIADPHTWLRGIAPIDAFYDFAPGAALEPLRGGFVRLSGGARIPHHRHIDRELTFVLEGEMVDGEARRFGPGSAIDMPAGSVHSLGVPPGGHALVALLHGRLEMLGE